MSRWSRGREWLALAACVAALWPSIALGDELADALARAEQLTVAIEAAKTEAEDVYAAERRRIHAEHAAGMAEAEASLRQTHGANGDARAEFEAEEAYTARIQAYRQGLEAFTEAWGKRRAGIEQARDDALTTARAAWEHPTAVGLLVTELEGVENTAYRVEAVTEIAPYRPESQAFPLRLSHDRWPVPPDAVVRVPVTQAQDARARFGAVTVEYGIEDGEAILRGMWIGAGDQYAVYTTHWTRIHRLEGYVGPTTAGMFLGHQRALTGGADGRLVLWNTEIGMPVRDIDAHAGSVKFLVRSTGHVVSATAGGIKVWDGRTLAPFMAIGARDLLPPPDPGDGDAPARPIWTQVTAVAINGPSGRLAYGLRAPAPQIQLWDVAGEVREEGIAGLQALVTALAFSPSGEFLAAGMSDGGVLLWRLRQLTPHARDRKPRPQIKARRPREDWVERPPSQTLSLSAHKKPITALAFTGDGSRLVTASEDRTAKVWDVESGEQTLSFRRGHSDSITSVSVRDKGGRLITGSLDGTAQMWNLGTGETIRRYRGHDGPVHSVDAVPGRGLLTTSEDGSARLWHMGSGWQQRALLGHKRPAWPVRVSDDGRRLLTDAPGRGAKLWDLTTGAEIPGAWSEQSAAGSVAMTSDGRLIARGDAGSTLHVWDADSPSSVRSVPIGGAARELRFIMDDKWLLVASERKPLERWNIEALDDRRPLLPESDGLRYASYGRSYAVSADGRILCARAPDGAIQMWDVPAGKIRAESTPGPLATVWMGLNQDGSRLLTRQVEEPGTEGPWTVRLWDAGSGEMLVEFNDPQQRGMFPTFSPDGTMVVTYPRGGRGEGPHAVTLWSADTGAKLRTVTTRDTWLYSATFSGDGARVVVAANRDVRLYEAATGHEVARLDPGFSGRPHIAWSADGTTVVLVSPKGIIDVWRPVAIGAVLAANAE